MDLAVPRVRTSSYGSDTGSLASPTAGGSFAADVGAKLGAHRAQLDCHGDRIRRAEEESYLLRDVVSEHRGQVIASHGALKKQISSLRAALTAQMAKTNELQSKLDVQTQQTDLVRNALIVQAQQMHELQLQLLALQTQFNRLLELHVGGTLTVS